jgi:hypothetical protein
VVGQYTTVGPTLNIFVNGTLTANAAGIPGAIFNGNSPLEFGASNAGTANFLTGKVAYAWLGQYNSSRTFLQALYDHQRPLFGL